MKNNSAKLKNIMKMNHKHNLPYKYKTYYLNQLVLYYLYPKFNKTYYITLNFAYATLLSRFKIK